MEALPRCLRAAAFVCIGVCGCSGNQGQLPSAPGPILSNDESRLSSVSALTVTPGCLHFTGVGAQAEHSLYVTPTVSTVLKASSSNPKQATISPPSITVTAHHTYAFVVDPLAFGRATLTISSATNSTHISETVSAPNLYTAGNNSILVFPAGANGNVAPSRVISGSNTKLSGPDALASDCSGNIYVANTADFVSRYSATASGNVSPNAAFGGAISGLEQPYAVAVDSVGHIVVACVHIPLVSVFKANANGAVAPLYTLASSTGGAPVAVAVDDEDQLHVVYQDLSGVSSIATYSATTSGQPPTLLRTIEGPATNLNWTFGLAISKHHYTWATDAKIGPTPTPGVWVFAPAASGNAKPTGTISGSNTRMSSPGGISFDSYENRYILDANGILKFTANESGNVAPVGQINGSKTQLNSAVGILVY